MIAGNIAQTEFISVLPNTSTATIEKSLISHKYLVVKNTANQYIGLLTMSDVVKYAHKLVVDCLSKKPSINFKYDLEELLILMEKHNYLVLPVFKGDKFYGVISYKDIIRFLYLDKITDRNPLSNEPEAVNLISAGIIHDFNNIMTFLIGQVECADRNVLIDSFNEGLKRIRMMTKHYMNYLKTGTICKSQNDLKKMIKDTVAFFVKQSKYNIHFNFPPDAITIFIEPSDFTQIISNLLLNSIQAMPDGGDINIAVDFYMKETEQNTLQKFIKISISDTGCGINQKDIKKIFQPFFTTKMDGSGMGLALIRYLVKQEGGFLKVLSEKSKGATFEIFLPVLEN